MFKNQIQLYFIDLNHLLRLIKSSSFNENYFASIGGYCFKLYSVLNRPNGSRVAPYLI